MKNFLSQGMTLTYISCSIDFVIHVTLYGKICFSVAVNFKPCMVSVNLLDVHVLFDHVNFKEKKLSSVDFFKIHIF